MRKLVFLFVILIITSMAYAELKPKQVIGKWKYTVQTDQGDMSGSLLFSDKEGKLEGEVYPDNGGTFKMTKVELKENNTLYFELQPEYDVIKVSVKIENNKFKGKGSTYQGDFTLIGEKKE